MAIAYALLTSLKNLLKDFQEHTHPPIRLDEEHVKSLSSNISFLEKFLEEHHTTIDLGLEIRIADAARDIDDVIETRIADRVKCLDELYRSLEGVIKDLDLIEKEMMGMDQSQDDDDQLRTSVENFVVSIEDIATKISLRHEFDPQMIPISSYKLHKRQADSISSKIRFLQGFMKDHNIVDHGLETRITEAARAAEEHIETRIVHLIRDQEEFYGSLKRAIEGLDLIKKEVILETDRNEQSRCDNQQPRRHRMPLASLQSPSTTTDDEDIVVGIEDTITKVVDKLTSQRKSDRQIISISGMGGIGKTTLAREVYKHPYVKNHFDTRAWATISKDYDTRESLVELLHCLKNASKDSLREDSEHELGEKLYKSLFGMRYLVIMDDVWDVEAWERLRLFFPASSGSGIVITTRDLTIAAIGSHIFRMDLLDEPKSWDLFCKKVFGKESCHLELKDVGKNIAKKCQGLPLSIAVIGGHLAKSERKTQEYWKYIEDNLSSIVSSEDNEYCHKILSLSYTHLPVHLKPCFLHMAIFPEDEYIKVSKLIKLWVAEGFLKPIDGKSLEEVARYYLDELIDRNLILVSTSSHRGKIKRIMIHDLLRDLCLKEALRINFLRIVQNPDNQGVLNNVRRIVVRGDIVIEQPPLLLRALICNGRTFPFVAQKLLRVLSPASMLLEISQDTVQEFTREVVNLGCLDFAARSGDLSIPPSFSFLWNLQSLDIRRRKHTKAPPEILEMPLLMHIRMWFDFPDLPSRGSNDILKNLQSVKFIVNCSFSENFVERVPNIKKLGVLYNKGHGVCSLNNIARLEKLESFYCQGMRFMTHEMPDLTFPHSLKKLMINNLNWDVVTTKIGSLPVLELLTLSFCSGCEWNLVEGQFVSLKFLKLLLCDDLECFAAEANHFPCLETLVLIRMDRLEEIPSDVGDITTLRSIELYDCADSVVELAKEIADVQSETGNEELRIKVLLVKGSSLCGESLRTSNFHVED